MSINEFIDKFYEILQKTYFSLNPLNPNNTEDNFQELLRHNIIKVFNCNVDSEVTFQRTVVDINGDEINLKNKTERYDLIVNMFDLLMELKAVEKLDESHTNQLLAYMNNSDYKYGAIINFRKGKSCKQLIAEAKFYEKIDEDPYKEDKYGNVYRVQKFRLINGDIKTEDFKVVTGGYLSNEININ